MVDKQFIHPTGEKNRNVIALALKLSNGPIGVSEIRKWIETNASSFLGSQYQRQLGKTETGKTNVPSARSLHTQLNELVERGLVERVIGNKYRLTSKFKMSDLFSFSGLTEGIFWLKTLLLMPEVKNDPKFKKALNETFLVMTKLRNEIKSLDE